MAKLTRSMLIFLSLIIEIALIYLNVLHVNIFSLPFAFAGIYMLIFIIKFIPEAIQSKQWPNVEGEITVSKMEKHRSVNKVSVYPIIKYSYTVDGETYESDRFKIGPPSLIAISIPPVSLLGCYKLLQKNCTTASESRQASITERHGLT